MAEKEVATQEQETPQETTEEQEEQEQETPPNPAEIFKPLPEAEGEEDFDLEFNEVDTEEGGEEEPEDEDKRTKDYWKKRADFYEKKAKKVDSIEAVDKALSKYNVDNELAKKQLNVMARKGRPQNEIFEFAKFARTLINSERKQLQAQFEKHYGNVQKVQAQAQSDAEAQAATRFGPPDPGAAAPTGKVKYDDIKDLPYEKQFEYADRLKPTQTNWPKR